MKATDPKGPAKKKTYRITHGGAHSIYAEYNVSFARIRGAPKHPSDDCGFRVVCYVKERNRA